ncbi:MAG: hypothetical protein E6H09_15450 [Bacteroidetes bacterium]|nr:MAG: hypothetical protein E6H09_15450 [Bacteroidota bacterium]
MEDKNIEDAALNLANNIDSNSLNLLKKYSFGKRGNLEFWQRISADSFLYTFSLEQNVDTLQLVLFRPFSFIRDFACNYQFDTSLYYKFHFSRLKDTIVRLAATNKQGTQNIKDTSLCVKDIFPSRNPFETLTTLTGIKNKYSFVGTSYRSDIGDFIEFWLSPDFKLTYLPDTFNMNPKFKKYWLDDFSKGKKIKEHWILRRAT